MFRIGPIEVHNQHLYVVRGSKGAVIYAHFIRTSSSSPIHRSDPLYDTAMISKHVIGGTDVCSWNGNLYSTCSTMGSVRIHSSDAIWTMLEIEYNYI